MATTTAQAAGLQGSRLYDYLTTTDHKKIGILYTISSFIFLAIGGLLALGVRAELAQPGLQYMDESVYNQLFTMHASVMIFWVIIPFLAGIG
ncbi:MAG: cbb3-type cytochrome c oxidase subunit I, partial [Candidatus Limnocylindrus sp.]